jgi:hypothetical protein
VARVKAKPPAGTLEAAQIVSVTLLDGQTGVLMLDKAGNVYTYAGEGWTKLNMVEVPNDPKV